jgi:hypothetical protein
MFGVAHPRSPARACENTLFHAVFHSGAPSRAEKCSDNSTHNFLILRADSPCFFAFLS